MLRTFAVSNYRSLRDVKLALAPLTVITGANGSGKA
jgi:AAA15 family ATPase/GTPase